jgi:hypothetical protein
MVPNLKGMGTHAGIPFSSMNRTTAFYGGNAAPNPPLQGAI